MKMKKELVILTLLLSAIFSIASGCGSRRGRHRGSSHRSHSSSYGHSSHSSSYGHGSHSSSNNHESHSSSNDHGSHSSSNDHESHGSSNDHGSHSSSNNHESHSSSNDHGSHRSSNDHESYGSSHGHGSYEPHNGGEHASYEPKPSVVIVHPSPNIHHHNHHHNYHGNHDSYQDNHQGNHQGNRYETTPVPSTPMPKPIQSWLSLDCDRALPGFMGKNYPRERVADAVYDLRKILSSTSGNSDIRESIKREVKDYFFTPNRDIRDEAAENYYAADCDEITSYIAPWGGCNVNRNASLIVNVPDLEQVIKNIECSSAYRSCSEISMCVPQTRNVTLLTLPAKEEPFEPADFSVETFKIDNGCKCYYPFENMLG